MTQPPGPAYDPHRGFEGSAPAMPHSEGDGGRIADLERRLRSVRAVAVIGVALGVLGMGMAAVSLTRTPAASSTPSVGQATTAAASASTIQASAQAVSKPGPADAGEAPSGTIILGTAGKGLPVLDIYEDFQCPACAQVERVFGTQVDELVASGRVEVRYHMMSFLDEMLKNDSSVRAANGGFCAHDQGRFLAWHDVLFANHPANEGDGWTDGQLRALADKAGLDTASWSACVASGRFASAVSAANELSLQGGVNSTPTYMLNGAKLNLNSVAATGLAKYVEANG